MPPSTSRIFAPARSLDWAETLAYAAAVVLSAGVWGWLAWRLFIG
jgi:hypothetical protein